MTSRQYAHKIPFIVKLNHNELLTYPNQADQIMFASMATILWCYLRNNAFKQDKDYHLSADLTGQANHLGVTIEADIIKQKLPENNGGYNIIGEISSYGKTDKRIYSELTTEHPIDLTRYQVLNCYSGRASLINSGGASGKNDLLDVVRTAVINKRAGGAGLISGRKTFQKPFAEGVSLFHAIQDVYLIMKWRSLEYINASSSSSSFLEIPLENPYFLRLAHFSLIIEVADSTIDYDCNI
jgi:fructose-bisphosphate aldolase, class I